MANETHTLADLIAQAVTALRGHGEFALAAAVEQNALHNQELAGHVEHLTALLERATELAAAFRDRADEQNGETR